MHATIYTSDTGLTQKYAVMLSEMTGIPAYNISEAKDTIANGAEYFYMGWLMASRVKGYKKDKKLYTMKAVFAVGMGRSRLIMVDETIRRHHISDTKVSYLQGGFDMKKLHGFNLYIMSSMRRTLTAEFSKKGFLTDDEAEFLHMLNYGDDFVCKENIEPVTQWLNANK